MRFRTIVGLVVSVVLASGGLGAVQVVGALPSAGAPSDPVAGSGRFVQIAPTRIVDTRSGAPLPADGRLEVQVTGATVPAGALAVALNLTVDRPTRAGFVTLYPSGGTQAGSNVNPTDARNTVANMAIVALPPSGKITAFANSGGHLIMDVAGYWLPAATATSGRYSAVTPARVLDTRSAPKPGRNSVVNATVTGGTAAVPADASAVAVTITATEASAAGFVTAWAAGQPQPTASNLNLPGVGATVPNLAIVPVGANGQISLFTDGGAHLIVDVAGWFSGASGADSGDGLFVPVTPTRIADSRSPGALKRLPGGLPVELPVPVPGGVPSGASVGAVALNLTVTNTFDDGYLTVGPSQVAVPNASNLNYTRGTDVSGLSITRMGANGALNMLAYGGTDLIADIAGWFTGPPAVDTGYRPTKCENLMVYQRKDGTTNSIMIQDRTIPGSARVLASGAAFGSIGRHCEYVAIVRNDPAGGGRITRIDVLGSQAEIPITSAAIFGGYRLSADGSSIFFITGRGANDRGDRYIEQLDIHTGKKSVVYDSLGKGLWDVLDVSADGRTVDVGIIDGNNGSLISIGWYRYDLVQKTRTTIRTGLTIDEAKTSPNGQFWAGVVVDQADKPHLSLAPAGSVVAPFTPSGNGAFSQPGGFRVYWTPQNDVAVSYQNLPVRLLTIAGASTELLDGVTFFSPSFPTFALL
jgi:hypothetical protein